MLELKGPLFHSTIKYIKTKIGEERYKTFVAQLPEDLQAFLAKPILSSKFYPAGLLKGMTLGFIDYAHLDPVSTYHDIGRVSAEEGFSGIYKIFFKVGTPASMIKTAPFVFKSYYSQGEMKIGETGKNTVTLHLLGSGIDHIFLCERLSGFIVKTMELAGGHNVRLDHRRCHAKGDTVEEWVGEWA
jgi:hypothetical protein